MSADTRSLPVVESKWADALEYTLFAVPAVFGLLFLIFARSFFVPITGGVAASISILVVFVYLAILALAVFVPVAVYLDAKRVRDANGEWSPSAGLYAVLGFFFTGLVVIDYLYKRNKYTAVPSETSWWWYGVAFSLVLAIGLGAMGSLVSGVWFSTVVIVTAILPVCLYKDAVYVCASESEWKPNPATYFTAALVSAIFVVVQPLIAGFYLYKRHTHVGNP